MDGAAESSRPDVASSASPRARYGRRRALWRTWFVARFLLATGSRRTIALWGVAVISLLVFVNALNVVNSYIGRDFITAVSDRHATKFVRLAFAYLGVFIASSVAGAYLRWAEDRFRIMWRGLGTRRLMDRYLARHAFFRLLGKDDVDNPDQRVTDDVRTFTGMGESVVVLSVSATLTSITFLGVLWSITPWLVLAAFAYAALGSLLTVWLGRPLIQLNNDQLTKEADLRYQLIRVREQAEPIAATRAEGHVLKVLRTHLEDVLDNFRSIIRVTRTLVTFTSLYNYLLQILPILITAPLYLSHKVEFGVVTQAAMAFSQVMGALSLIVTQYETMSSFFAVSDRLYGVIDATRAPRPADGDKIEIAHDGGFGFTNLTLHPPNDPHPYLDRASLLLPAGRTLLVTGRSAAAKSSLFLAIAGLYENGLGKVVRDHRHDVAFLPRHPFVPAGTLRELLLLGSVGAAPPDAELERALGRVGLAQTLERYGLDTKVAWQRTLSVVDQQRIALARVFVTKPKYVFLDHVTEAIRANECRELFEAFRAAGITAVTFGDPSLASQHDAVFDIREHGEWSVVGAGA